MTRINADLLKASLLGGALGDALGAPLEIIKDFNQLHRDYGEEGLDRMLPYTLSFGDSESNGTGIITDDTTMTATTQAAINLARQENADNARLLYLMWQGYLQWGARQTDGKSLSQYFDPAVSWPADISPFWFKCGAGRGTIAALATGIMGTIEKPLSYDTVIRGKHTAGLNSGCGGMMRAAPIAFMPGTLSDVFNLACRNAAITHGHADAYLATGCTTLMIRLASEGKTGAEIVSQARAFLVAHDPQKSAECIRALDAAISVSGTAAVGTSAINSLPSSLGYKNAFLAIPVLAQVAYAVLISDRLDFRRTISIAVTHSGDSDSVGAIVGNILGARWGMSALPADWLAQLRHRNDIEKLSQDFINLHAPKF